MAEVWAQGDGTVRSVLDATNARMSRQRHYTTILTVMLRLHDKGLLRRRRVGRRDIYTATMSHEDDRRARSAAEVDELLDEYGDLAVARMLHRFAALEPARRYALRRFSRE